jgi:hypothetical protein
MYPVYSVRHVPGCTARLVLTPSEVPVLGATMMRLRNRVVSDRIFEGGVSSPSAPPKELAKEFYEIGARPGHYHGFCACLRMSGCGPRLARSTRTSRCPCCGLWRTGLGTKPGTGANALAHSGGCDRDRAQRRSLPVTRSSAGIAGSDRRLCPQSSATSFG